MAGKTKTLTPVAARSRVKAYLIRKYGCSEGEAAEILLWDKATVKRLGWYGDGSTGQVAWEGGPYEWVHALTEDVHAGKLTLPGFWIECSTSWCIALYRTDD